MVEREYTPAERAGIARAFKIAKRVLWDGNGCWGYATGGPVIEKFICTCIERTNRRSTNQVDFHHGCLAKVIVQARIGEHWTLESWLHAKGVAKTGPDSTANLVLMQKHRHAWLDLLIEEFSK